MAVASLPASGNVGGVRGSDAPRLGATTGARSTAWGDEGCLLHGLGRRRVHAPRLGATTGARSTAWGDEGCLLHGLGRRWVLSTAGETTWQRAPQGRLHLRLAGDDFSLLLATTGDCAGTLGRSSLYRKIRAVFWRFSSRFLRSHWSISIRLLARCRPDPTFCHVDTFLDYVRGSTPSRGHNSLVARQKITEKYYITHLTGNARAPRDLPATTDLRQAWWVYVGWPPTCPWGVLFRKGQRVTFAFHYIIFAPASRYTLQRRLLLWQAAESNSVPFAARTASQQCM